MSYEIIIGRNESDRKKIGMQGIVLDGTESQMVLGEMPRKAAAVVQLRAAEGHFGIFKVLLKNKKGPPVKPGALVSF